MELLSIKKTIASRILKNGTRIKTSFGYISYVSLSEVTNLYTKESLRSPWIISISKKYDKRATERNKLRRKLSSVLKIIEKSTSVFPFYFIISVQSPLMIDKIIAECREIFISMVS